MLHQHCASSCPLVSPKPKKTSLLRSWLIAAVAFVCLSLAGGCGSDTDAAQDVVKRAYEALNKGDPNAYMDTLLPSTRNRPDVGGILWQLTSRLSLSFEVAGFSANLPLGELLTPTAHELHFESAKQEDGHVLVSARGKLRALMGEYDFCEAYDVVKENGKWYVDRFHPSRGLRLARIAERNAQRLGISSNSFAAGDQYPDLNQLLAIFGDSVEVALDLCE